MASGRQRFEHYAMRVTCFLLAGLIAWNILRGGKGLAYAFYGFFFGRWAVKGVDIDSAQNWWITLVILTIAGLASFALVSSYRDRPLVDRWVFFLLTGCFFAQALLLLSGRWRGVWSFTRRRPAPARLRP
jgi:hypothetical protein